MGHRSHLIFSCLVRFNIVGRHIEVLLVVVYLKVRQPRRDCVMWIIIVHEMHVHTGTLLMYLVNKTRYDSCY